MFKKAKEAYERDNWYTLYSVAVDLGIEVGEIDEKHIEWIEEDIKLTMGRISQMGQLFAWVWYTSDDEGKERIMDQYFKQVYNWPPDKGQFFFFFLKPSPPKSASQNAAFIG